MIIVSDRDLATPWSHGRDRPRAEPTSVVRDPDRVAGWRWAYLAPWFAVCAVGAYVRCLAAEVRVLRRRRNR